MKQHHSNFKDLASCTHSKDKNAQLISPVQSSTAARSKGANFTKTQITTKKKIAKSGLTLMKFDDSGSHIDEIR